MIKLKKIRYPTISKKIKHQFSDEKLEQLLLTSQQKEFTFVEIIGGVLGFIIGIVQLIISAY